MGNFLEIKRFAVHDGPGIRTTFFLKGCPLHCLWCHNPESIEFLPQLAYYEHKCIHCGECSAVCPSGAHVVKGGRHWFERSKCVGCGACEEVCLGRALRLYGSQITVASALQLALEDRDFFGKDGGVTLSGGEPLLQEQFCFEFLTLLKQEGIHAAIDTGGAVEWKAFELLLPVTDLFLYDFKHADSAVHRQLTGQGNERILDNLRRLSQAGAHLEIRYPLIPGCNDSAEALQCAGNILNKFRIKSVKVLPYHALARSKYRALGMADTMPQVNPPDHEAVQKSIAILQKYEIDARE